QISNNTWHHVFVTYDGETMKMYLDGTLADENTDPSGNIEYTENTPLCIGEEASTANCEPSTSEALSGQLDDVRLYSRALSADEISDLADGNHTTAIWTSETDSNFSDP